MTGATSMQALQTASGWGWNISTIRFLHARNKEQLQDGAETSPPSDFFTPATNREQIQNRAETSPPSDFFKLTTENSSRMGLKHHHHQISSHPEQNNLSMGLKYHHQISSHPNQNSSRMGLKHHHHQISSHPHTKRAQLMQLTLSNWRPACGDWFCSSPSGGTPTANELPAQTQTKAVTSLNTQTQDNVFFWEFKLRDSALEVGHQNFSHDNWTRTSNGVPEYKVSSFKSTLVWKTCEMQIFKCLINCESHIKAK